MSSVSGQRVRLRRGPVRELAPLLGGKQLSRSFPTHGSPRRRLRIQRDSSAGRQAQNPNVYGQMMKRRGNNELLFSSHRGHAASTSMLTIKSYYFLLGEHILGPLPRAVSLSAILLRLFPDTAEQI